VTVQQVGPVAQLLSAGIMLEDVSLQDLPGISELLAALGPAAGTLKSLCINRLYSIDDVQDTRDNEVSRILSFLPHMADRPSH
jgi:hypothetical protein